MSWELIIPLIIKYGLPLAETIWRKWAAGTPPTAEDWAELRALTTQTARDRMLLAMKEANIDPNGPQGQKLLALTE